MAQISGGNWRATRGDAVVKRPARRWLWLWWGVILGFLAAMPAQGADLLDRMNNQEINQILRLKVGRSKVLRTPVCPHPHLGGRSGHRRPHSHQRAGDLHQRPGPGRDQHQHVGQVPLHLRHRHGGGRPDPVEGEAPPDPAQGKDRGGGRGGRHRPVRGGLGAGGPEHRPGPGPALCRRQEGQGGERHARGRRAAGDAGGAGGGDQPDGGRTHRHQLQRGGPRRQFWREPAQQPGRHRRPGPHHQPVCRPARPSGAPGTVFTQGLGTESRRPWGAGPRPAPCGPCSWTS